VENDPPDTQALNMGQQGVGRPAQKTHTENPTRHDEPCWGFGGTEKKKNRKKISAEMHLQQREQRKTHHYRKKIKNSCGSQVLTTPEIYTPCLGSKPASRNIQEERKRWAVEGFHHKRLPADHGAASFLERDRVPDTHSIDCDTRLERRQHTKKGTHAAS